MRALAFACLLFHVVVTPALPSVALAQDQQEEKLFKPPAVILGRNYLGHVPEEATERLPNGFQVSEEIQLLRAAALEPDFEKAKPAMQELGNTAMDRVSAELLTALARGSDRERSQAAAQAVIVLAERAARNGHKKFAGRLGQFVYLSDQPDLLRARAFPEFMLLETKLADEHRQTDFLQVIRDLHKKDGQ